MISRIVKPAIRLTVVGAIVIAGLVVSATSASADVRPDRSFKVLGSKMPSANFPYYRVKAKNVSTIKRSAYIYSHRTDQSWSKSVAAGATFMLTVPVRPGETLLSLQSLSTRESMSSVVEKFEVRRGGGQYVTIASKPTAKRGYALINITNPYSTRMVANLGWRTNGRMVQGRVSKSVGPGRTVQLRTPMLKRRQTVEFNAAVATRGFARTWVIKRQVWRP